MLIVLDTKTAMARLINQEDLFSTVMLSKLENYFSYAVAESAKKDIMATARFPNINCVIKNGDSLYSLDFHNMNIQEISIEELIPIQQTDFGEKVFSETIEEFKYCVGDFYYGTQITLIEYPLICFESAEVFNIIPRIKTASSDILEILSEYFSNNSLQDLKTEILNYMGSHCTMMVENKNGIFGINGEGKVCTPDEFWEYCNIENIVRPYLKGYNVYLDEICARLYNYIVYKDFF